MTHLELRNKFLEFWKEAPRNHVEIPSSSLVPENDPTTLFTGSGMQPMMPYLLGQEHPLGTRITDSQKCFRAQDIEEVGDNRHTTFFEMLGNWSFGDYFKEDQLTWYFDFLTGELGLDPGKLFVTVFGGDERYRVLENNKYQPLKPDVETISIWKRLFAKKGIEAKEVDFGLLENAEKKGMGDGRIFSYGVEKNWWSRSGEPDTMPNGEPGGPDSEVFYDFGAELHIHEDSEFRNRHCHPNCDCGRFLEIGNSVFMQYLKRDKTTFTLLPKKNVDFGGGLERTLAAVNNNPDIFQIDIFNSLRRKILDNMKLSYTSVREGRVRIFLDHSRAAMFLITEGLLPGKNERESVLRRLIRRADDQLKILELESEQYWNESIKYFLDAYKGIYNDGWSFDSISSVIIDELRTYETVFKNTENLK